MDPIFWIVLVFLVFRVLIIFTVVCSLAFLSYLVARWVLEDRKRTRNTLSALKVLSKVVLAALKRREDKWGRTAADAEKEIFGAAGTQ